MKYKPCPFCSSDNVQIPSSALYIECLDCGVYGPSAHIDVYSLMQRELQEAMVWDKWDKRHEEKKIT